jgi:two-component system nitrate/nitrite response regulator NarL
MMDNVQILIVEDHTLYREAIVSILENEPGFLVVGQGATAQEAIQLAENSHPDLILLDMDLPLNGVSIARNIAKANPLARFLFLTISRRGDCPVRFLTTGERIYILENVVSQDFFNILKALYYGKYYLPPTLAASLLCDNNSQAENLEPISRSNRNCQEELTRLEQHILGDLAAGLSIPEVAMDLHLPDRIIKQSVARILRKRHVHSRVENTLTMRCGEVINPGAYLAIEIGRSE